MMMTREDAVAALRTLPPGALAEFVAVLRRLERTTLIRAAMCVCESCADGTPAQSLEDSDDWWHADGSGWIFCDASDIRSLMVEGV